MGTREIAFANNDVKSMNLPLSILSQSRDGIAIIDTIEL